MSRSSSYIEEVYSLIEELFYLCDYDGVIKASREMLAENPKAFKFHYLLGITYGALGRHDKARSAFLNYLRHKDDDIVLANYMTTLLPCGEYQLFLDCLHYFYFLLGGSAKMILQGTIIEALRTSYILEEDLNDSILKELDNVLIFH